MDDADSRTKLESMIGTNVGSVHEQQQGTGLATILQGNEAVDTYAQIWRVNQANTARKEQDRLQKRQAALGAIKGFAPEFFYKHQQEMSGAINDHVNKGAELIAAGIDDPFNSTDPRAVEWQKERNRIAAMSNASMQIKERWDGLQKQVAGANPDDYDADSLSGAVGFFNQPLSDIVAGGKTPPVLMKKRPYLDGMDFIGKRMSTWQQAAGEIPDDTEVRQFVKGIMDDPANRPQLMESYGSRLAQMDAEDRQALTQRARAAGAEPSEQLMFEDAKRYQKRRQPFDLKGEINSAAQMAERGVSYSEVSTPQGFWKAPKKGSKEAAIKSAVDAAFNSDPRWMEVYNREGQLPRGAEETDAEYGNRVKAHMAKQLDPLVGVQTKSGKTDRGADEQKQAAGRDAFIADIRSGDQVRMQGAANILVGTNFSGNMRVEDATVQYQGPGAYWLELDVTTPLSTDRIKEQVADEYGLTSEQVIVENRQGKKIVTIGLAPGAVENQTLVRLIDNYSKQTGATYDTKFTERSAKTAMDAISTPVGRSSNTPQRTTVGADFFK